MRGSERGCLIQQHHCDHVLHTDVRHVSIAYCVGFVAGDSHYHLPYVGGGKRALFEETDERIQRSLNWRAHCPFLDVRPYYLVCRLLLEKKKTQHYERRSGKRCS